MIALVLMLGLCIGSFLNVCIHRIPLKMSIVTGQSRCPECHTALLWRHKIPLLSYVFLWGRCFFCGGRISWRYPLVEALTACLAWLAFREFGVTWELTRWFGLILLLVPSAVIDIKTFRIPNVLILMGFILWLSWLPLHFEIYKALTGLFTGFAFFALVRILGNLIWKKESLGAGDIKLAALIGLFLGVNGLWVTTYLAILIAGLVAAVGLISGRLQGQSKLPFGGFLAVGAIIYLLAGEYIIQWVHKLVGVI